MTINDVIKKKVLIGNGHVAAFFVVVVLHLTFLTTIPRQFAKKWSHFGLSEEPRVMWKVSPLRLVSSNNNNNNRCNNNNSTNNNIEGKMIWILFSRNFLFFGIFGQICEMRGVWGHLENLLLLLLLLMLLLCMGCYLIKEE